MKRILLLLLSCTLLSACRENKVETHADLVIRGGTIITMDPARPRVEALAVGDGKIIAMGSSGDIGALITPETRVIELGTDVAYPGFYDAHAHFLGVGKASMQLDLSDASNWGEILRMVAEAAEKTGPGGWIEGRGWHQEKWDTPPADAVEGLPRMDGLNTLTPENPVLLTHASGHMVMVNQKALEMAGITTDTPDPEGGQILRDTDGQATGILKENAEALVRRILPGDDSPGVFDKKVENATRECLTKGLTTFQDAGATLDDARRYQKLADEGNLRIRLNLMLSDSNDTLRGHLDEMRLIDGSDHILTIRAIKRWLDGALGSHGAWLLEPYTDLPTSCGMETESMESMRETARLAAEHGYQLCVHAIGDRANRVALDIYQEAFEKHPDLVDPRWRIEHAQHLAPEDLPRFASLGVIASMQPTHCTSDGPWVALRLGTERAERESYLWRSLLDSGAHLASGTDAPVEDVDPLATFFSAVTRRMKNGKVFVPDQRMTRLEALRSMTIEAAFASFQEEERGSLEVGKLGDITILSGDILQLPEEELPTVHVVTTIIGGDIRYRRP